MLRPTHGVANCSGLVRARRRSKRLSRLKKYFLGNAAAALHHLRRVAGKVAFQYLKDASWILQRRIGLKPAKIYSFSAAIFAMPALCGRVACLLILFCIS